MCLPSVYTRQDRIKSCIKSRVLEERYNEYLRKMKKNPALAVAHPNRVSHGWAENYPSIT